jgi:hypothetical protein
LPILFASYASLDLSPGIGPWAFFTPENVIKLMACRFFFEGVAIAGILFGGLVACGVRWLPARCRDRSPPLAAAIS